MTATGALNLFMILPAAADPSRFYGWLQQGYTFNFANPNDRINFGVNFNWLANEYRLNQFYLVWEKALDQTDKVNLGYRVDLMAGHDAPFLVATGLFSNFTGFDRSSGFGNEGPGSFRQMNAIGMDMPQFYLDIHDPGFLTKAGVDFRIGKFYTLMGREVYPGKDTDFYSRTYENIIATPFTHTGVLATIHACETWDVMGGIVRGWDVFTDNNDRPSYHGAFIWNSPDKRDNWTTAWIFGPEQFQNNSNIRTLVSSYYTAQLGKENEWTAVAGGHIGHEAKGAVDRFGNPIDADWYGLSTDLFHDINPKLRLGFRFEWFRDAEGSRTAFFGRPGFNANFYDITMGVTIRPSKGLRIRPELRYDWSPDATPFNNQRSKAQFTPATDVIWEF